MEFVINKIMSIDKDAENYRKNIDELLKEKEKELQEGIKAMQNQWIDEAKGIKESVLKEKLSEAEEKANKIIEEKNELLKNIKAKYVDNKEKIVEDVFSKIISSL